MKVFSPKPPSVPIGFVPQKLNLTAKLDWLPQTCDLILIRSNHRPSVCRKDDVDCNPSASVNFKDALCAFAYNPDVVVVKGEYHDEKCGGCGLGRGLLLGDWLRS